MKPNNVHLHTLFTSPGLVLISVTPFWAVALKLVRYQKHDSADITAILRNGTRLNGVQWSSEVLERWLRTECWPMGYESYPDWLKRDMCTRIAHAVAQLNTDPTIPQSNVVKRTSLDTHLTTNTHMHSLIPSSFPPTTSHHRPSSSLAAPTTHRHLSVPVPEPTMHHRLARPASMTFPPPSLSHSHRPPPPHHFSAQPLSRTHSMPLPLSIPPNPPSHPYPLTSSPESHQSSSHLPTGASSIPESSLLLAPDYPPFVQPERHHSSSRSDRFPPHSLTWPHTAPRHPHAIPWASQLIFSR